MSIIARSDESYPKAAWSHQLRLNAAGCFEHYCEGGEADEKFSVCHTQPAVADRWYHVAGTANADDKLRLIIDGREEGTPVDIGALRGKLDRYFIGSATGDGARSHAPRTLHPLTLSPRNPRTYPALTPHPALTLHPSALGMVLTVVEYLMYTGMGMWEGGIAEVRLWNTALNEDEVKDNMRKVLLGTERGLVGYWRLNEGPGGMVFDQSSYGNLGPIKGDPSWTANNHPINES